MKVQRILPLLVVGLIGTGLQAEDLDFGLKLRGDLGTKAQDGVKHGLAVGFATSIPMPMVKGSKIDAEVGYRYYTGDGQRKDIPTNTLGCTQANSVNFQKLNVSGFYTRFAFGMPITEALGWHAGLEVDFLKSRMDAIGDFRTSAPSTQAGSWTFNPEKKGTTISPVAGISYQFNTAGALELNLFLATYKQITLTPYQNLAGSGANRILYTLGSKNVNTLKLELGYTFRF